MIQDILKQLGEDKQTNRNIIEKAINESLKDELNPARTYLLTLELGSYITQEETADFLKKARPETYLKLFGLARDAIAQRDQDKALAIIEATLDYISRQPVPPPPAGTKEDAKRFQFNSFAEMLVYCTMHPSESCLWVAKDECAFLKLKSYILFERSDFTGARLVLEKLIEKNPLDVASMLELNETYKMEKKAEEGLKYLQMAYDNVWFIEDFGRLLRAYGYYYLEKEEYEKALGYYLNSLMYDSSVEADKYVSNELNIIRSKMGDKFKVPAPSETAKFMAENKLPYLIKPETEVTLMKVLKKLYELKMDADKKDHNQANFLKSTITSFESNLKRVTLNKKELIEVVRTDVYTNMFMHVNSYFRYAFKLDKAFKQMPPSRLVKSEETKNILAFLYKTNDKNLVEGFPITIFVDKLWMGKDAPAESDHEKLVEDYSSRITKSGYTITSSKKRMLPVGTPATKLVLTKGEETRCSYVFNISERAFGIVSAQVEYEGDINDSYLTDIVDSWEYLRYNKTQIAEVLDKVYSGYHSLLVNGGISKEKLIKFASEIEFMFARIVPVKNKQDAIWEITGRKLVVGYILKELKTGTTRENLTFDKLRDMLNDDKDLNEYFNIQDDVIGYYTKAALSSPSNTRASYISTAKEFLTELEK